MRGEFILALAANFIVAGVVASLKGTSAGAVSFGIGTALFLMWFFIRKKSSEPQSLPTGTRQEVKQEANPHISIPINIPINNAPTAAAPAPAPKREPLPLKVEFEPSMHQSEKLYLAVKNVAVKQMFRAQCRVVERRNDPNPQPRMTFDLTWQHGGRDKYLQKGESGNLLIASAGADRFSDMEWMKLEGTNAPDSHWPRSEKQRPEYDLEITVFGLDSDETQMESFTLKAGAARALEMHKRKS